MKIDFTRRYSLCCWLLLLLLSFHAHGQGEMAVPSSAQPVTVTSEVLWLQGDSIQDFPLEIWVDDSQQASLEMAQQQNYRPATSAFTFGTKAKTLWVRFRLKNPSDKAVTWFLHHLNAYHIAQLDVFVMDDLSQAVSHHHLSMNDAEESPYMFKGEAAFPLTVPALSEQVVYARVQSFSHQWGELRLLNAEASKRSFAAMQIDVAVVIGLFLALIFYNAVIYFSSMAKEHIFYALYLLAGGTWIALSYGFFAAVFDWYGQAIFQLHLSLILMPIFLVLFMMQAFETRQNFLTVHRILLGLLFVLVANFTYGLFDTVGALRPATSLAAITMLVTWSVSVWLFFQRHPLAGYFLLGHSLFVVMNVIAVLFYKGWLGYSYLTSHAVGIGIVLEALTLAFIIVHRIRMLKQLELKQVELTRHATTDFLTGLYNRRYFFEKVLEKLQSEQTHNKRCLLMLDIDHFKQINDQYGHSIGDDVIRWVAQQMQAVLPDTAVMSRFGGEEFLVYIPECSQKQAILFAEQLRNLIAQPIRNMGDELSFKVTVSLGVMEFDHNHTASLDQAIQGVDEALYRAKRNGRNQVQTAA